MEELVKKRFIGRYDVDDVYLILKIYQKGKKFKYTVQDGDGPNGRADVLVPWAESKFEFDSEHDAEVAAELAIEESEKESSGGVEVYETDCATNISWGEDREGMFVISHCGPTGPWEYMKSYSYCDAQAEFEEAVNNAY